MILRVTMIAPYQPEHFKAVAAAKLIVAAAKEEVKP